MDQDAILVYPLARYLELKAENSSRCETVFQDEAELIWSGLVAARDV